ncbi:hypothetical protein WJX73_007202 [Symbiochloris irregularis]|uniref:J domain-containing protein n=1 Tax=Symbiochloris irregularis TaxID=706552 RepID=A0AAW1NT77_9CHLO
MITAWCPTCPTCSTLSKPPQLPRHGAHIFVTSCLTPAQRHPRCRPSSSHRRPRLTSFRARQASVRVAAADRTPWQILDVQPGSSDKDLKRAFKLKARKLHPDVNKAADASERFMECRQAYLTLTDPRLRAEYDRKTKGSASTDWGSWPGPTSERVRKAAEETFYGFADFFRDVDADLRARRARRDRQPTSLWEELADIGEEFVEFLEGATGTRAGSANASSSASAKASEAQQKQQQRIAREEAAQDAAQKAADDAKAQAAKAEKDANDDIERMLAELKQKVNNRPP